MKKILTLFLTLTFIITSFCSCGCSMDDGEAGDKGNIQTDDVGDGGNDTDDAIKDKEDKTEDEKDNKDDSVTEDLKDGVMKKKDKIETVLILPAEP